MIVRLYFSLSGNKKKSRLALTKKNEHHRSLYVYVFQGMKKLKKAEGKQIENYSHFIFLSKLISLFFFPSFFLI